MIRYEFREMLSGRVRIANAGFRLDSKPVHGFRERRRNGDCIQPIIIACRSLPARRRLVLNGPWISRAFVLIFTVGCLFNSFLLDTKEGILFALALALYCPESKAGKLKKTSS